MSNVLIAGGTGLIGKRLSELLEQAGHQVRHLSRQQNLEARFPAYSWDPERGKLDPKALEGVSCVINLAGAGIADRPWTQGRKRMIISSRVSSTLLLRDAIMKSAQRPSVFISSAAIGYYGNRGEDWVDEGSEPGKGFLTESCMEWEKAIREVEALGIRTVRLRIGLVLSSRGGALPKLLFPLSFRIAPVFGRGRQWYSWIHIDDLCRMFLFAMEKGDLSGVYNAVGPHPVTNRELVDAMVGLSGKKALVFSLPALALRLGMGEMADTVLFSTRVRTNKILAKGFEFDFPDLPQALEDIKKRGV